MYYRHYTKKFQKSLIKVIHSGKIKRQEIDRMITLLASGNTLDPIYRDHQLKGEWAKYRECHVKGDLLLVYRIEKERLVLVLAEIGTHSYLDL